MAASTQKPRRHRGSPIAVGACMAAAVVGASWSATDPANDDFRQALRRDWQRQLELRLLASPARGTQPKPNTPQFRQGDARGACDGVKDGTWGFHTALEDGPWWQVDLGENHALDRIVVYNRCDSCAERIARMRILFSDDGKAWHQVYQNDGTVFGGKPDGKPLVAKGPGWTTRFVRLQLPGKTYFHLDEVEVYGQAAPAKNLALNRPADQSSVSQWSNYQAVSPTATVNGRAITEVLKRGRLLAADLERRGVETASFAARAAAIEQAVADDAKLGEQTAEALYFDACRAVRTLAWRNPLVDFDALLVTKRVPNSFSHMSDQYLGWWSRPGGGLYILSGFRQDAPSLTSLSDDFAPGSFLRPCLSYDGRRALVAYCRYYPKLAGVQNKLDKSQLPEDSFFHVYEIHLATRQWRQLTHGKYNDFDAQYLPDGRIVFLSTRRAQAVQCGKQSAVETMRELALPETYVRCGGGASRPCAVYTLHTMGGDGGDLCAISAFEMFEWTPSVREDGSILYSRWDYIDRHNMPFMSLWATNPDGTNPRHVYGNYTLNPHCIFEARSIPGSNKLLATASAHHSITAGSLVLIDPHRGLDGGHPIRRITPEVCFPETEGWPASYYVNPWPLAEDYYLTAWSCLPLGRQGRTNPANATGVYLGDTFGNLILLYRDEAISTMSPIPLAPRPSPPAMASNVDWSGPQHGSFLVSDIYCGLPSVARGDVKRLRVVAVPGKTQPEMNHPQMGVTHDDPGKCVLGTVPVEKDGSAHFFVPAGVTVFFQALDARGKAIQTMRTGTYVQPGQRLSCIGCHEPRAEAPVPRPAIAARRPASKLTPGPPGAWPLRFDQLVQPVLEAKCVSCHQPSGKGKALDLQGPKAYQTLIAAGKPSLAALVAEQYRTPRSTPGHGIATRSGVVAILEKGHYEVKLSDDDWARLFTWMDTCAQRQGAFSADQEERLRQLRTRNADVLADLIPPRP